MDDLCSGKILSDHRYNPLRRTAIPEWRCLYLVSQPRFAQYFFCLPDQIARISPNKVVASARDGDGTFRIIAVRQARHVKVGGLFLYPA